jgi:drug/metabolite transporter (DMT)-like permease
MGDQPRNRGNLFREEFAPFWIFIAMGAVSTAAILIRWSDSHPLTIAMWRLIISVAILLPFSIPSLRKDLQLIDRRTFIILMLVGGALAAHFALWIWSFEFTTVASSVLLVTTHPLFVAAISYFAFNERLSKKAVIGMCLAFIGTFLIIGGDLSLGQDALIGNILALSGGIMAGIYLLMGHKLRKKLSLPTYAFMVYAPASLILMFTALTFRVDMVPESGLEYLIFFLLAIGPDRSCQPGD